MAATSSQKGAPDAAARSARAFLARHVPFDAMEPEPLTWLSAHLAIAYHPAGAVILSPELGMADTLYIVQRGAVERRVQAGAGAPAEPVSVLEAGESFPLDAVLERRAPRATFTAVSDTFCYIVGGEDFAQVLERSARLREYTRDYFATLLRDSRRELAMELAGRAEQEQLSNRALRSLLGRDPVTCVPSTTIGTAMRLMHEARVGSVLVVDEHDRLAGILTRHDVLERIALARRNLDDPMSAVMTPDPKRLDARASAYDVALLIAREGIRHVPVVEEDRVIGIVTERDLFALHRTGLHTLRRTIGEAGGIAALARAAADVRDLARRLLANGLASEQLTHIVSTLNDAVTARAICVVRKDYMLPDARWCWLAFGSEGRYEQTISTDQDNGIVFEPAGGETADRVRERFLPFADAVNRALDACGFPLCKGGIMAGNPKWCLSLEEWRARFERWIAVPEPQELLHAAIFFDFRGICGDDGLAMDMRSTVFEVTRRHPVFLRHLASFALESRPPLGLLGGFADDDPNAPGTIDLKRSAARLFTDAARVLALRAQVAATNTADRLRQASAKLGTNAIEARSAVDAFYFVQGLRLRGQVLAEAGPGGHRIATATLSGIDARMLKESLRQARTLQARLALDFQS